jgi:hypothetical protein
VNVEEYRPRNMVPVHTCRRGRVGKEGKEGYPGRNVEECTKEKYDLGHE